ncbi:dihydroxyacetone kinase subunit L [Planotetraspora thailandica]|uniref:Dihydroxyacetone kinase subunit L n=1 Tax=Planotetraspora thailandica TaxID=487172 RepID=A0A8J3V020_9ACTN|nr:dihydroxyacetone kinase subunit DhaL [Planotetraspora thailandica]GII54101.1 dihydroxyacetone kinase subunit L [Planotetraspora thailandica]
MDTSFFLAWINAIATAVQAERDHLTQLDAAIGDADHGANLDRGFAAVRQALTDAPPQTPGAVLTAAGSALIRKVGGASGPLYGTAFRQMGRSLGDAAEITPEALAAGLEAALAGIQKLGGAAEGDKTLVDALAPAVRALGRAVQDGTKLTDALAATEAAAQEGARATVPLEARKGRASYLGPRSVGHEDPGAASTVLIFAALREAAGQA